MILTLSLASHEEAADEMVVREERRVRRKMGVVMDFDILGVRKRSNGRVYGYE